MMKLLLLTDIEGVGGITNFWDWCVPGGRLNDLGGRFLTEEVNAAVEGFFQGGVDEITVWDGHGSGPSIHVDLLDERVYLQWGTGVDNWAQVRKFDAIAFVGQHPMAGAPMSQMAHTQTSGCVYFAINGMHLGEFGQYALVAREYNVPTIFGSGDLAFTKEANALIPTMVTVAVKEGLRDAPMDVDLKGKNLFSMNYPVRIYPRKDVLVNIRKGAKAAAEQFRKDSAQFLVPKEIMPQAPYVAEAVYRATEPRIEKELGVSLPARKIHTPGCASIQEVLHVFYSTYEWGPVDGTYSVRL